MVGFEKPPALARRTPDRPHLAPLWSSRGTFPAVDDAPVLAEVKQTVLDVGCGSARLAGAGRGAAGRTGRGCCGGGLDPRFAYCYQANDAGYGPYVRGVDPEYDWYDDRDGDGIVCET
jgi:hypothetical protein